MSVRVEKMTKIDINHKFKDYEEACKYAKKLYAKIDYMCKKDKYRCDVVIGVSNIIGRSVINFFYDKIGEVGKPKVKKEVLTDENKIKELNYGKLGENGELGNVYNDWHLHVLMVACPCETLRQKIKSYINKNWWGIPRLYDSGIDPNYLDEIIRNKEVEKERKKEREILGEEIKKDSTTKDKPKVYNNDCDLNYAEYIFGQSESLFFLCRNYIPLTKKQLKEKEKIEKEKAKEVIDFDTFHQEYLEDLDYIENGPKFCFKRFYNICVKLNTLKHYGCFSRAEKSEKARLEQQYKEMVDYYAQFHKEHTKRFNEAKRKKQNKIIQDNYRKKRYGG